MITKGPEAFVRTLQRGCLSPERLELKQGAVVMFTKNDPTGRYVNGTLGVVDDFDAEDGYPVVRTRGDKRILAEPSKWKFRAASDAAPRPDAAAVAEKQRDFVAASVAKPARSAGIEPARPRMPWTPQGAALNPIRATHAKAYAPWTADEDGDLKRRHQTGARVETIAVAFGRKPGAIRSR